MTPANLDCRLFGFLYALNNSVVARRKFRKVILRPEFHFFNGLASGNFLEFFTESKDWSGNAVGQQNSTHEQNAVNKD